MESRQVVKKALMKFLKLMEKAIERRKNPAYKTEKSNGDRKDGNSFRCPSEKMALWHFGNAE